MNIVKFISQFGNEQSCKDYFYHVRLKEGVVCKKCSSKKHYWLSNREQFECSVCKFRTTLKSGTVMENSRLSFQTWFLIFFLMTATKKGLSAKEMQRQIGHKRYTTIWSIMHRIRNKMGERDQRYTLKDMVEFDEAYFEKAIPKSTRNNIKRGKGSQRQVNVVVTAESIPLENQQGKQSRYCGYFKMKVIPNGKAYTIDKTLKESIEAKAIVFSDKSSSYVNISDYVEAHFTEKSSKQTTNETLKWVHIAISNAKRTLLGIYHKISGKYLQNYLNEFTYKLNRRYFCSIFDRLLIAVV